MVAVVEHAGREPRVLSLLNFTDARRALAWRDGRAIDAAEFLADVAKVAAVLPPARSAVNLCVDRYAFLVAFCAVLARGQTNLLPPSRAPQAIAETLAANPGSYVLGECAAAAMPRFVALPPLGGETTDAQPPIAADQVAAIGYTSGSTGQPKPNPKRWASFRASTERNVAALGAAMRLAPGGVAHIVATVPPQHMYGIELSILLPLLGPFAVHGGQPLFPADVAAALADVPEPRLLVTTPVHLRALLADPGALPELAAIASATAPLDAALAAEAEARYGAPVLEMFGSTETCVIAQRRTALETDWRLYEGIRLRPQPDGTLVEASYFDQPVALQDLVELRPDGFRLCGRHADLIEIAGKRASLADLTRRLLALPGVCDAAVLQQEAPDAIGVRRIAALVVAPERSEAELLEALRAEVDPAFLPRPLRKVDALPRNETGKLPRAALLAALERDNDG
jgi:acyl-coenzyme A synthetase/AMP-(fatty) acid ligase